MHSPQLTAYHRLTTSRHRFGIVQVAAVSGDVRRCLELLRRSAEITAAQAKQSQAEAPAAEQSQISEVPPGQLPDQRQGRRHGKGQGQGQNQTPSQQPDVAQPSTAAQAQPPSALCLVHALTVFFVTILFT